MVIKWEQCQVRKHEMRLYQFHVYIGVLSACLYGGCSRKIRISICIGFGRYLCACFNVHL